MLNKKWNGIVEILIKTLETNSDDLTVFLETSVWLKTALVREIVTEIVDYLLANLLTIT